MKGFNGTDRPRGSTPLGTRVLLILLSLGLLASFVLLALTPHTFRILAAEPYPDNFRVLVLYGGEDVTGRFSAQTEPQTFMPPQSVRMIEAYFAQSLLVNLSVQTHDLRTGVPALDGVRYVYLDESTADCTDWNALTPLLVSFVEEGGALFVTNPLHDRFDKAFLGAKKFAPVSWDADKAQYPDVPYNAQEMQDTLRDYASVFVQCENYEELAPHTDSMGLVPAAGATPLVTLDGKALYNLNRVGRGFVLFTGHLLPARWASSDPGGTGFAQTTHTMAQQFVHALASMVLKEQSGYAIKRVFGTHGRPSIAWQLHYEEITGIANGSLQIFSELCEQTAQVPSFTLIRNSYTWYHRAESVTYLLGDASKPLQYTMDAFENAYSSGTHIAEDGRWLELGARGDVVSYFDDQPFDERAYPCVGDFNGDGQTDLIAGAADGTFTYYEGQGLSPNWEVKQGRKLTDATGNPIAVSGYSAPAIWDADGDGLWDIVSGCEDGGLYYFRNLGGMTFAATEKLPVQTPSFSMPTWGLTYDDGWTDLLVGGTEGTVNYYKVRQENGVWQFSLLQAIDIPDEDFAAPAFVPMYTGLALIKPIAIGTRDGTIRTFHLTDTSWTETGYLDNDYTNYKGNSYLKFGNNCVPRFYDINGDGAMDLIAGQLEYGMAYPIDSPYFPYRKELQEQIDYAKDRHYYMGVHAYTHRYADPWREAEEWALHKKAFESYGLSWAEIGANQHTWYTGVNTLAGQAQAGLLWNSGFKPALQNRASEQNAMNALTRPFAYDTINGPLFLFNTATFHYTGAQHRALTAKYELPVSVYYHCDFAYRDRDSMAYIVNTIDDFVTEYHYNFVSERQLVKSVQAAYLTNVDLAASGDGWGLHLSLRPDEEMDAVYARAAGVKIELGALYKGKTLATDARAYYAQDGALYLSLTEPARVWFAASRADTPHIVRVNAPADISSQEDVETVSFWEDGLMLVEVYSPNPPEILSSGWNLREQNGTYCIWKNGEAEALSLRLAN